ncbi:MAG TPA: D-glycero-beta-D-manno-heptose-7-phosphate kinase [Niabella sp.]|nr:D-glycero-beta-D-manno-heptose-7-phosphate kinase [Niabella sp.]HOZ97494.1 D-glycero-beta-D-manno-heptose-7-phosphate kinase [Niabella sp.]HQW15582.1 D-glycero-beta-D-manno-heptose-7-phosphate kinase [Niabella sp.]HQX20725.1 D-glycero-beta-D-manno-heptose-7-phosphate kinase [Niabella sp.]HQX40921.1 D-glycero-beta-D-manno-heptose-7-phosphate kinase [Niabella sp.]
MIHKDQILKLASDKKQPAILVIGDIMADRYVWGTANRISPEAPVPVLMAKNETITLGGAGNVAQNLRRLNARVALCGIVGDDPSATTILQQLREEKIDAHAIIKDHSRPSTLKTRVMAGNHQLLRVDRELSHPISTEIATKLLQKLEALIQKSEIVLLSDYNKGLLTPALTQKIISICIQHSKKVMVDPKGLQYEKYKNAWLIKPNRKELSEAMSGLPVNTKEEVIITARKLLSKTKSQHLVVTLSEEGLALISKRKVQIFPVRAQEVFDVTGAGDSVFAALGYFLALGIELSVACELANYAAAIAVSKVGSVAVTIDEIFSIIDKHE